MKREIAKERAHDCPKRLANYGLNLPVSIPTLGKSLAHFYVAQIAQIKRIYYLLLGQRRAGTLSCKVRPESGAHCLL